MKHASLLICSVLLTTTLAGTQGVKTHGQQYDGRAEDTLCQKVNKLDSCFHEMRMKDRYIAELTAELHK